MSNIIKAQYFGKLLVGDKLLSCAVLEDETRILTGTALYQAFDKSRRGLMTVGVEGTKLPRFLAYENLKPFTDAVFVSGREYEVEYVGKNGQLLTGYNAELLPEICKLILQARRENVLLPHQHQLAISSEILLGVFAKVGIIALIDEATGYQHIRREKALQEYLSKILSEDRLKWAKAFPDEYYIELFRLLGWEYNPFTVKRPQYLGKLTNDIVYERIAPYVLERLNELNPKVNKRRKYTHHQFFTVDFGLPELQNHLTQLIAIMRTVDDIKSLMIALNRALPKQTNEDKVLIVENANEKE